MPRGVKTDHDLYDVIVAFRHDVDDTTGPYNRRMKTKGEAEIERLWEEWQQSRSGLPFDKADARRRAMDVARNGLVVGVIPPEPMPVEQEVLENPEAEETRL